ncbi:MAG: DUF1330 domain-containing protein [Burkholderiaceae bacterium]|nr:DUF1330 domain-containing protein [Burkholderiaceae bacterium]
MKIIGLIKLIDSQAFDAYRAQVGDTVALYGGVVQCRGMKTMMPWNELNCEDFDAFVEIEFPSQDLAQRWADSPEYASLLPVRRKAMRLTLFGVV